MKKGHYILGSQPCDMSFMLVDRTIDLLFFFEKRFEFPVEGKACVLANQHGHLEDSCKPAIEPYISILMNHCLVQ